MSNASNHTQKFIVSLEGNESSSSEYALTPDVTWTLVSLYSICCCVSLVGNTSIIFLIYVIKSLKNMSNYFLVCIAISDLLFLSCCVPLTVVSNLIENRWTFGALMCKVVGYVQAVSVIQRALTMTASSAVQYHHFRQPFSDSTNLTEFSIIISIIWAVSLLFPVPIAIFSNLLSLSPEGRNADDADESVLCLEFWPDERVRRMFGVVLMVLTYVVPLLVSVVTKVHIAIMTSSNPPGEQNATLMANRKSLKRKTFTLFAMIVTLYAICWLPIHAINMIGDVNPSIYDNPAVHVLWLFAHLLAVSNSAINPVIMLLTQRKFRAKLQRVLTITSESDKRKSSAQSQLKNSVRSTTGINFNRKHSFTQHTKV